MKTRILAVTLTMIFVLAAASFAAPKAGRKAAGGPARGGAAQADSIRERGKALVQELGLTREQVKQIMGIVKKYHEDAKVILQSSASADEKKKQVAALKTKAETAINAILTPEQQQKAKDKGVIEKLLNLRLAAKVKLAVVLKQLDLTTDQKAKVKAIFADAQTRIKAIRSDTTLDAAAKQAKMKALHEDTLAQVKALLTPEQKKKLGELMNRR